MGFLGNILKDTIKGGINQGADILLGKLPFKRGGRPRKIKSRADGGRVMKAVQTVKDAIPDLVEYAKMAKSMVGLKRGGRRRARGGRM